MRWLPWRRSRAVAAPSIDEAIVADTLLRPLVDTVFAVRDHEVRGGHIAYRGRLRTDPARAVEVLLDRFRPFGYTPFFRAEGDEVVLHPLPLAEPRVGRRVVLNVVLFALTCLSTLWAGTHFIGSPAFDAFRRAPGMVSLLSGVPFAATLLAILGVHEFGHYFAGRRHGAAVSLPYFIPAPPPLFLFGTLGAVIRMRSPVRDRNSLFDIAAAGPLAGLVIAIPAMALGLEWSTLAPQSPDAIVFGDSLLRRLLVHLRFGPIPEGMAVFTHPVADAAWVGFFVTALNLFPVGQLDGGRIAYALFGGHHRAVGIGTFGALIALGAVTQSVNWFVWAGFLFLLVGLHHSPPLDDITALSPRRYALGLLCLVLLVLLVPPVPIGFY
jgi:membrane-associated protease RseP (regulator of RpoE activity)